MSADTSNFSHIKDEDVLRKMWQDTDDFGKKKEIRSHMYKLREQRLREFYNGGEITESRKTTTSGKVTHDSTHADSLVDQSFQSLKSKEVRDSESPTRDIHYKSPDKMASKEWQVETNNETSLDGKTKIHSSAAALQGTQKIDGGQIDFKAKTEKMASVYRDANENSSTTRSQSSSSSHLVTSSNTQHNLPSNTQGVTKVIRETKSLPDGSTVTTTRYDTTGGTSLIASQSSTSNRQVNENIMIELPGGVQEVTKVIKETKTLPYGSTETSTRYNTTTNRVINEQESNINIQNQRDLSNQGITKITKETKTSPVNSTFTITKYDSVDDNKHTTIDDGKTIKISSSSRITSSKAAPEFPSDLQGVTKVTKETKTLPDGSIMTITKYDTATGTSTHSEIIGNVKMSKDHSSITNKSTKHTEEAVTVDNRHNYKKQDQSSITNKSTKHSEEAVTIDNRQQYRKQEDTLVDTVKNDQHYNIDNKITVVSTTEKSNNKDDRRIEESINVTKHTVDETDGNKISPSKIASTKITTNDVTATKQQNTNRFINTERQQEEVTRDKNIREVVSTEVYQKPREKESPKPENQPSKPTTGQYETTYRTDYTNRKISVDVSPTHDAFARSLRSVSPDRIPSRGNHRTSNSSIPEKMRHPSRISPDRQPKDRSISPTKSDTFKKTVSQETITISTSKQNITNKTTKKDVITTNDQYLTRSRTPSPKKLYKHEIVTDLDEDLNVTTVKPGSRPTSLELTRRPKKITDRSPSSPLTDLGSPNRSPVKEIRRSSSFRSPTKEVTSPTKPPKGISAKSPTKEVSTKNLPEDKPLKRTDTYEERCRQILGITEVTEKRKNSLERSSSKRNSLRRNMSSQFVDNTEIVTSPTKSPVKERPVSPTKSPVKERPANPTKSPVKERPKSPVKQRPVSPVKQKPVSPVKQRPVSPVKQRPASPTKSPSKQKPSTDLEDVEITKTAVTKEIIYNQKENDITEKQPLDISMETPRKTGPTKSNDTSPDKEESSTITTVRNETRISTTTKDGTVITDDNTTISRSKSTREPVETSKSPVKDTQKFVKENDTTIINKSDIINIEESVTIDDIKRETITKGTHPNDKISSQPNIISKQVPNNIKDSSSSTSKFILQEKLITDIHSSTEAIVDDNEVINITETEFNKIPVSNKTPDSIGHPKTIIKTTDKSTKTTEYTSPSKKEKVKTITKDTLDEVDNITQKSTTVTDTIIRNTKIHVSKDTKQKEPKEENYPVPTKTSSPSKPSKINRPEEKTDEETIIDEFVVEKDSDTPKIILGRPISEDIKPIKKNKDTSPKGVKTNTITKEDDTVVVTDEFEIVSNPNEKPTNKKPGLTEYPSQIKKPITKKASQDKIIPSKSKPIKEKPQLSEFPSQIKKDKKPARREPIATEKFFEPISYENKVPVEEPLMIKKNITPCIEDEVTKSIVQKTETVSKKPAQKEIPVVKQKVTSVKKIPKPSDKNIENPISRKPINGVSEYKNQYSRPKPTSIQKSPSNKIYSTTEVTTKTVFKPSDKINFVPTRPTTKTVVNGIHKPKQSPSLTVNSVKVTKTTDAVFKRTNKVITSKENEIPGQKLKKEPAGKVVIKKVSPVTKMQPSDQLTTKKHIVTTTITLKDNRQPKLITKTTKSERNRVTDLKQKHVNEYISTDTDEDEKIVETRETVDVTRRTINKKPEKKCITTKTVIINNNVGEKRQVIVDLQRSKSSREPTPDRICPVPINNGGFESPRYPDEIVEPDDDEIRRKPKRLSDIPLIESENVSNFSRITEITDSKVVTEVDKVEETDESLLSVNNKINLFLDNVDKVKKKHLGPAPKVERPKLEIDAGLESDECLLSVSEKVTKFVNAADQFINVHDVGERPKSPRCKFYNDKNTSETFITTEQKVSETQSTKVDTEKISLDNLNKIDTKSEVVKTTSVTGEMENRAPSPNKFKPTDKQEPKYPNYSTITKKVSLENLDIKNSIKSSKDVPENRGSKKRLSTEYVTTTTETRQTRSGSRDLSPEDTRYNRTSPDRKSPDLSNKSVTPTRRPSNDYGSTKTRKTEDISTSRDYSPDDDTATPKTSKTTEVEDKKTILSSTGRLRSTESIKKARAIFENIAKDQEPASPANKSPITKNKISKKLNYIGDKKNSPNLTETHPKSDETPHYMLSLDRRIDTHNQVTNITTTTSTTDSRTINTESNVSTRDSRPRTRSPIRSTTRPESPDTQYESSDVPHYMLPLDRSIHTNSHVTTSEIRDSRPRSQSPRDNSPRARAPDDPTKSAEVPHYMLPLDHTVHSHSNVKNTTVRESRSKVKYTGRDSPRNRSPEVHSETDEVPHYRLPLDRSEHTHNQYTTSTIRKNRSRTESPEDDTPRNRSPENRSQTGEVPHYMLPLDRSEQTQIQYTTSTVRQNRPRAESPENNTSRNRSPGISSETGEVPHYRLPLDRSEHTHNQFTTSTIRKNRRRTESPEDDTPRNRSPENRSQTGEVPHYRLPLDRSEQTQIQYTTSTVRQNRPRAESPENNTSRNRSPGISSETGEVPHYRLPLDRSEHTHNQFTTSTIRKNRRRTESPEDDTPRNRSPENRSQTGEVPHYRLPLDRSEQTQIQYTTSTVRQNRPRAESPKNNTPRNRSPGVSSETGDVPHYRLPLDRSEHTHNQFTTSTIRKNRPRTESPEDDTPRNRSPENRSQTGEVPHYRLPLDRSEQTQIQYTTSTVRKNRPRAESPKNNTPRNRSPGVSSETGDVPHYRLPLDRSEHTHNQFTTSTIRKNRPRTESPEDDTPRNRSPDVRSQTGEVPHYRLPLDRSEQTHSQNTTSTVRKNGPRAESPENNTPRNRSPGVSSETREVPHYRLPLERNVQAHSQYTTSTVRESRLRTKSPEDNNPRNKSPMTRSENGDVPHYRLPLDRSVHTHSHYTTSQTRESRHSDKSPEDDGPRNKSPMTRSEAGDVPHYRLPLDRSVHTYHYTTSTTKKSGPRTESPEDYTPRNRSPEVRSESGDIPHYRLPLDRSVHTHSHATTSPVRDSRPRSKSPGRDSPISRTPEGRDRAGDVPHYMLPLDKNTPSHVPHGVTSKAKVETRTTKFGITLKKVQPGSIASTPYKSTPNKPTSERKFSNIESITEKDIENIFEIEILEDLLEKIESYELRRVIRTQIRLVKKLISENTLTIYIKEKRLNSKQDNISRKSSYTRKYSDQSITTKTHSIQEDSVKTDTMSKRPTSQDTSPQRVVKITKKPEEGRKPSPERTGTREIITTTTTTTSRYSPTRQQVPNTTDSSYKTQSRTNYTITGTSEVPTEITRISSPERGTKTKVTETSTRTEQTRKLSTDKTSTTTVTKQATGDSVLKKTEIRQKKTEDDKPEWVKQRNLKKVSSTSTTEKNSTSIRKAVKEEKRTTSVASEPTDLITSSYGVGPTDENGSPLFGLKALRTQSNGTTKVQGTFVKSEYYSENGNEPVGQISVTKYSTDPRDLSTDEQIKNNDLVTSVTTTQQFGYDNTPSLEALTSKKGKQIEDSVTEVNRTSNFKRKNSVKALSQKFIDTAVESLKNERQTTYPKAGLILRTSSFKDSKNASSDEDISTDVMTATKTSKQTTKTTTTSGGTFLSNKSTVTGITDVISRMKTEEYQEGDSSEDIEAKSLLNKFIGSQVILSGMENRSLTTSKTSTSDVVPITSSARKTIKITTTVTEDGKTKTKTLVFQSPITEEELENIWDEQTLRLLLDQSTQYEERRVIRNRLRTVMAEQEACADLVEKASQDQPEGKIEENVSVEKTTTQSPSATTTTVTKVTTQQQITKKPLSPFAKFRQLDKQNSINTPPGTPGTPKSPGNGPLFKFTDPAVSLSAATIKERLLFWCKMKTKEYENVQLDNFSTSWADGLAFCALIHHFLPDAFDYHALTPKERRHNFELAFRVASEKADIFPLLDVDDMMATRRPDWKCVFTYVQSVYRRFKDEEI